MPADALPPCDRDCTPGTANRRKRRALEWTVGSHDYRTGTGGGRYRSEPDASLAIPIAPQRRALATVADYRAGLNARDTPKPWLQVQWESPSEVAVVSGGFG